MLTERPHTINLPNFDKGVFTHVEHVQTDPRHIAQQWLSKFEAVLASKDVSRLSTVLRSDCWWRDHLALEWDYHTVQGLPNVTDFVGKNIERIQPYNFKLSESGKFVPKLTKPIEGLEWVESMFSFETKIARGSGMLRIVEGNDNVWKGYLVYTMIKELKGFEELTGTRRAHGGNNSLLGGPIKGNWQDRRDRQLEFLDEEPQVLIIGAGKGTYPCIFIA